MLQATNIKDDSYKGYILGDVLGADPDPTVDYYAKNDGNAPFPNSFRFAGQGCEAFGLVGDFENRKHLFRALFEGLDPRDQTGKTPLVQNWKSKKRRPGMDLTFSAPKSVSVALAYCQTHGKPEMAAAILEAHRSAVLFAFAQMEANAVCRAGKGGQTKMKGVKMFAAAIDHDDTRPVKIDGETFIDPQLHTHLIAFNVALCPDGKTRSIEELSLNQQIGAAGAVYRAKLAEALQQAGLSITNERVMDDFGETAKTTFKVNGVSDKATDLFSKRTKTINEYMEEHSLPANQLKKAVMATRAEKNGQGYPEIRASWAEQIAQRLDGQDIDLETVTANTVCDEKTDAEILNACHQFKKKIRLTRFDVAEVIAQIYTGHPDAIRKIQETTERVLASPLVCRFAKTDALENPIFCSTRLAVLDKQIRDTARASTANHRHKVDPAEVNRQVAEFKKSTGFSLSDEQEQALRNATSGNAITLLKGRAGSGKTSSALAIVEAYKAKGYKVIGTALANEAARKLEEDTGMKSVSVTKLLSDLEKGKFRPTADMLLYVDEAGMMDIENTAKLLEIQRKTGCRMILAGDVDQLDPVGAGSGLRILQEELEADELKEIRRQRKAEDKALANDFYSVETEEQSHALWERLQGRGMVTQCPNAYTAIDSMAQAFVDDEKALQDKIAMASTNDGVRLLNRAIQRKLVENGNLPEEVQASRDNYDFREGDAVRFSRSIKFKAEGQSVINGSLGTVVNDGSGRFRVRLENGHVVTIREDIKAIDLAYAKTIHRSQGQSIDNAYLFVDGKLNRNLALVAYTRMKDNFKMFGEERFLEEVKNNLHRHSDDAGVFTLLDETGKERVLGMTEKSEGRTKQAAGYDDSLQPSWMEDYKRAVAGNIIAIPEPDATPVRDRWAKAPPPVVMERENQERKKNRFPQLKPK
jgi:conjugative relaxase-like TrwC/TraI family protein